jgi:hypothetical protein
MTDFDILRATEDSAAGTITLTWDLTQIKGYILNTVTETISNDGDRSPTITSVTAINSVSLIRTPFGDETPTVLSAAATSPYTDTPATRGAYTYHLAINYGAAHKVITSNPISGSEITSVTLAASASGTVVSLAWSTPAAGKGTIEDVNIDRSIDGGTTWFTIHTQPGMVGAGTVATPVIDPGFQDTLATVTGQSISYRVRVNFEKPETDASLGTDRTVTSNTVTVTV